MPYQVTVKPSHHTFSVDAGETILDAALREGFALSYGCRNGACGTCKGKVLEGRLDYGDYQEHALSDEEKASGLALFCCAKPVSDVTIEAKEISAVKDIQVRTMPCRVEKIAQPAEDVRVLYLKLPANERLQFLAGQYIDVRLKEEKPRSFSMANAPHDDAYLELHVRHVMGGQFTDYVFNAMKVKDVLHFEGPHGSFFLREDSDKPIIFLATGTGFAPIKAMVEHAHYLGIQRRMVFYWGARTRKDLYLEELPRRWAQDHPEFQFIPVLSGVRPEDGWSGRTGHVHEVVLEDDPDLSAYQVYACGAPAMVEAAHRAFITRGGLPEDAFFSDAFLVGSAPASAKP